MHLSCIGQIILALHTNLWHLSSTTEASIENLLKSLIYPSYEAFVLRTLTLQIKNIVKELVWYISKYLQALVYFPHGRLKKPESDPARVPFVCLRDTLAMGVLLILAMLGQLPALLKMK